MSLLVRGGQEHLVRIKISRAFHRPCK